MLTVRWYLKYTLSYRDVAEMMKERGLNISHTTIMRWVHEFDPEIETGLTHLQGKYSNFDRNQNNVLYNNSANICEKSLQNVVKPCQDGLGYRCCF